MRIGHGFDAHRLEAGRKFVVGGVQIAHDRGPAGHSDGDALAHAISDAILGACALGDLGTHFPSSDERWRDADSMYLLAACVQMAAEAGYQVSNLDATVIVQRPVLAPHIAAIRASLATVLGIELASVSIKAKTTDGMGFTGDGSGIAVHAVALIERR
ncbi:MAG TPA: 2-C-methyl-D-erythritol 2,4-cyclodiphosphate synthase [Candidatus Baltobacteraceae bacterium]|jgi:2-C-methyl-D-erythritol 2,4-cyclodiphosphate synthase